MKKRKSRRMRPLEESGNVIYRALVKAGLTDQARRMKIFQSWDEAVGSNIAARTMPQSFSRGCLVVKAASATWQNELVFLKGSIIEKLNTLLGKNLVRDLKVISGHIEARGPAGPPMEPVRPTSEDFEVARETSLPISDPEVKAAFEHLMAMDRRAKRTEKDAPPAPAPSPTKRVVVAAQPVDSAQWGAGRRPTQPPRR